MSIFKNIFNLIIGDENAKHIKKYQERVRAINALEEKFSQFSDEQLKSQTNIFKQQILNVRKDDRDDEENYKAEQEVLNQILPEAFAVVREASKRVLGMRHFDVQLIGGMALHDGNIAEMSTGEGKTFVETLPTYLNALTGRGVHVITVNDYLVKRDSEWMGRVYKFLGLSVGCVNGQTEIENRKEEYASEPHEGLLGTPEAFLV